jgi:hypothetical protein
MPYLYILKKKRSFIWWRGAVFSVLLPKPLAELNRDKYSTSKTSALGDM